jgi:hypothetical protein
MAKKKQFAGKKTKLAKLPLTQALASQAARGAPSAALFTPPAVGQPPLTWEEVSAGRGEPLVRVFLFLVRELADLNSQLQTAPLVVNHHLFLPPLVPGHTRLVQALGEARENLRELQGLLSLPCKTRSGFS